MTVSLGDVGPADLATYLGQPDLDQARATQILSLAFNLCAAVVNPLPDGSDAVILDVAARAFTNPTNAQSSTTGPFSASYGSVAGGLWLTRQNRETLRVLAGRGGAFMIDTTPAAATLAMPWWDANVYPFGGVE